MPKEPLIITLFAFKLIVPSARDGWSKIPAIDFTLIVSILICFIGLDLGYAYRSWTKSADEYHEWYVDQQPFAIPWVRPWNKSVSREKHLWFARLGSIAFAAFGLFALASIVVGVIGK